MYFDRYQQSDYLNLRAQLINNGYDRDRLINEICEKNDLERESINRLSFSDLCAKIVADKLKPFYK